ncbi:flagellar assembly protein H [Lusitaniella coriacea LEGE 07157]|uniref:Flagellar assembly protein H n=1 Tax=Lusitaniella coriacea LEGE 07157 TaxID=945747 RepID=A0A8J7B053_9CYAN|nr:flagellar assembly protein H [Lusitaniella coriacea]MBE9114645.1 flagellar assembly protein H [Lusitaniella coriacea LEGE 07157]
MTSPIDHDAIFKELLSTFFLDFLELFVPRVLEYAEPSELSLEPTETVREVFSPIGQGKKKVADVVARLSFRDQEACFLVHVESQSSAYSEEDFRWRMFHYFSRLHEKYRLPVYPIALFTFDEPFQEQENSYVVSFPDREVLSFNFVSIQLNRLNWRDFLERENPVASALMAKMRIAPSDRAQVKAECLRLLATLELNPQKMEFISGFIGTYLRLTEKEEKQFQQAIERMDLTTKERMMQFVTDWQEKGREQGRQEGLQEGLQEGQITQRQEDILRILEVRFEEISGETRELVGKIEDIEVLGTLLVQSVTAQSLEAFELVANQSVAEVMFENGEQSLGESQGELEV